MIYTQAKELEGRYDIRVVYPGMEKTDFTVTMEDNELIIKTDNYSKSFIIPKDADKKTIRASYKAGILNISILKREKKVKEILIED